MSRRRISRSQWSIGDKVLATSPVRHRLRRPFVAQWWGEIIAFRNGEALLSQHGHQTWVPLYRLRPYTLNGYRAKRRPFPGGARVIWKADKPRPSPWGTQED